MIEFNMSFNPKPPQELPKHLLDEYSIVEKEFIDAIQTMNPASLEKSFTSWEKLLNKVLEEQSAGMRYHKGGEVHNMGACKIYTQQTLEAFSYFLMGYVEDLLSLPLESANQTPGAKTLRDIFKLSEDEFKLIYSTVEKIIKEKSVIQNPKDVVDHISNLKIYNELEKKAKKVTLLIAYGKYPSISHIPGEWEKRVFIGGDYEAVYLLDAIIKPVLDFEFAPIIAAEFKSSPEDIHHDALLLLHNCRYAIFDVSSKGGHMMEAERTLDYGTETLFVCRENESANVSAMLKSLGRNYEIHFFKSRKELKDHIFNFLRPAGVEPSKAPE